MRKRSKKGFATDNDLAIPPTPRGFFRSATLGKYHSEYVSRRGRKPVVAVALEDDVAEVFQDAASVNSLLRAVIQNLPRAARARRKPT